jgi:hypothetical protein
MTSRAYLHGDVPILGPIAVAITGISNTAVTAIGADNLRHGILFHNPNASTVLRVNPAGAPLVAGAGGIVIEPLSTWTLYDSDGGNAGNDNGLVRVNCAWNVVADTAGAFGLTAWSFTDNNQSIAAPAPVMQQNMDIDIASPNGFGSTTLTTVSSQIIGSNANRRGILFHNAGTQQKAVCPANLAASFVAGSVILLPKQELRIEARGKVRINCGFNAATANNSDGSLTGLEFV